MSRPPRLPKPVLDELDGLDWVLVAGARHWRLLIEGEQVAVFGSQSFLHGDVRSTKTTRATIRRFKRRLASTAFEAIGWPGSEVRP